MKGVIATLGVVVAAATLSVTQTGCEQGRGRASSSMPQAVASDTRIKEIESKIQHLEEQLVALQGSVDAQVAARARYSSVEFDPSDSSYRRVNSDGSFGSFAVSVQDVRPFGDGVRVKLNIGNPSSAGFTGAKLMFTYGPRAPDDPFDWDAMEKWKGGLKKKEITLTESLQPGNWNSVSVTLPKIAADQFGYLRISISTDVISLAQ